MPQCKLESKQLFFKERDIRFFGNSVVVNVRDQYVFGGSRSDSSFEVAVRGVV